MAITVAGSGDQAATVTTEHTLLDVATAGSYQFNVDLTPIVAGDAVELYVKKIFKAGGTLRIVYFERFTLDDMIAGIVGATSNWISNALTDSASLRFTLKQALGTSRTFTWEVLKAA